MASQVKFRFVGKFPFLEAPDRLTRPLGERPRSNDAKELKMSVKIDLGMCCPCNAPGIEAYRLLTFPDGIQVRVRGLDKVLEEAYQQGKKPHWSIASELVKQLSEYNYIPAGAQFEYEEALLKEYRLFFEKKKRL